MTDAGRKDATSQLSEGLTPDSQKSTTEVAKEKAGNVGDSVASAVQPNDDKSAGQKGVDSVTGSGDDKSLLDKAKDTVGLGK